MSEVKIKQNRFQMSYKKDEVPKYEKMEEFLMEDLGVYTKTDIYKRCVNMIYDLRKKPQLDLVWTMAQPKFNQIEIEMLKEISKTSRMDIQKTLHRLLEVVYTDQRLRQQIFSKR